MKKLYIASFSALFILLCILLPACQSNQVLDSDNPVILTIWHNYGGPMRHTMDELVDEFNDTTGAEKGIILSVTSISGTATLHEKLTMAANKDPGAPELPDITTAYPRTAILLAEKDLLVDIGEQFSPEELARYVPQFLEEGMFDNDKLYVFPTAKSTEVLFVNKTAFDRFAYETDISFKDLRTFEGIAKAAEKHYEWTNHQNADIPDSGKTFFMSDSHFNLAMIGHQQLGDDFLEDEQLNLSLPGHSRFWEFFYEPSVKGHFALFDGYASDLMKTGDIICALGSTAGVLFYPPTVTYANNITEPIEYAILPYPVFEGGSKVAIQRGGGMSIIKSTKEKEYAASIFLKWFTEPEQNLRFISSTGYLPVTEEAFGEIMEREIERIAEPSIKQLLETAIKMHQEYEFYIPPTFDEYDSIRKQYEAELLLFTTEAREEYLELLEHLHADEAFKQVELQIKDFLTAGGR